MKLSKSRLKQIIKEELATFKEASDFGSRYSRTASPNARRSSDFGSRYNRTPSPNAGRSSAVPFPPRGGAPDMEMSGGKAQMSMEEMTQYLETMGYKIVPIEPSDEEPIDVYDDDEQDILMGRVP